MGLVSLLVLLCTKLIQDFTVRKSINFNEQFLVSAVFVMYPYNPENLDSRFLMGHKVRQLMDGQMDIHFIELFKSVGLKKIV